MAGPKETVASIARPARTPPRTRRARRPRPTGAPRRARCWGSRERLSSLNSIRRFTVPSGVPPGPMAGISRSRPEGGIAAAAVAPARDAHLCLVVLRHGAERVRGHADRAEPSRSGVQERDGAAARHYGVGDLRRAALVAILTGPVAPQSGMRLDHVGDLVRRKPKVGRVTKPDPVAQRETPRAEPRRHRGRLPTRAGPHAGDVVRAEGALDAVEVWDRVGEASDAAIGAVLCRRPLVVQPVGGRVSRPGPVPGRTCRDLYTPAIGFRRRPADPPGPPAPPRPPRCPRRGGVRRLGAPAALGHGHASVPWPACSRHVLASLLSRRAPFDAVPTIVAHGVTEPLRPRAVVVHRDAARCNACPPPEGWLCPTAEPRDPLL